MHFVREIFLARPHNTQIVCGGAANPARAVGSGENAGHGIIALYAAFRPPFEIDMAHAPLLIPSTI
jgi:hypothetical protein